MTQTDNGSASTLVSQSPTSDGQHRRKRTLLFWLLFLFFIVIILIVYFFFFRKTNNTPSSIPEDSAQVLPTNTATTTATPTIADKVPPCAPAYTGGTIVSHTSTDTTWSWYYSNGSSASVSAYVAELKSKGWSAISEKTIVSTTFWDLKKESCTVNLRYHAPDEGVIIEMKN